MVFRRQPDRTPTLYNEQTESEDTDNEEDDDYFSVEPVNNDEEGVEDQNNCEMNPDVTGAASSTRKISLKVKHLKNLDLEKLHHYTPGRLMRIPRRRRPLKERKKSWTQKTLMTIKASCVL